MSVSQRHISPRYVKASTARHAQYGPQQILVFAPLTCGCGCSRDQVGVLTAIAKAGNAISR